MNWTKKHTIAVIIILLLGLAIRILPLLPPEMNLIRHVPDDAYYLYCEADNLAHGKGLSFDGTNPTTTSRPLYILLLAGIDMLVGRSALPQTAYLLGVLADILTCLLIVRFLRKIGLAPIPAISGMVFYIFSARIVFYAVNGMETPFAMLAIVVLLNLYRLDSKETVVSIIPSIGRGITIALMMLLRLDYIFIVVPVLFYELWLGLRQRSWNWFWVGATSGLLMVPWVWWSMAINGSLMPPSGDALITIFAPQISAGWNSIWDRILYFFAESNSSFYLILFLFKYDVTAAIVILILVFVLIIRKIEIKEKLLVAEIIILLAMVALAAATIFVEVLKWIDYTIFSITIIYCSYVLLKRYLAFRKTLIAIAPFVIGFIALTLYYTTVRIYFRLWNTIEGGVFITIMLGALCHVLLKRRLGIIYVSILLGWVMSSNIVISAAALDKGSYPMQERFERAVLWIKENIPPGTVLAAANGGILQWYSGRTVVDVAGIEDIEAYKALKAHKLYDYLKERDVKYLVDPKAWVFRFYKDYWGVDIGTKLEEVYDTDPENKDNYAIPGFALVKPIVYKLL